MFYQLPLVNNRIQQLPKRSVHSQDDGLVFTVCGLYAGPSSTAPSFVLLNELSFRISSASPLAPASQSVVEVVVPVWLHDVCFRWKGFFQGHPASPGASGLTVKNSKVIGLTGDVVTLL